MSLNVKDPEAHRLAQEIARQTGETLTQTVVDALREKLARLRGNAPERLAADLQAIRRRAAPHVQPSAEDPAAFLYDEHGLPK
jgi:antitoxin VapB